MLKSMFKKITRQVQDLLRLLRGEGLKTQLIKEGFGSLVVNVGNKAFVVLTGVLLVRLLGKAEYGIYSYILSLVYVLILPAEFGISNLVVRETAQGIAKDKPNTIIGIWRWSIGITLGFSAVIILITGAAAYLFGKDYFSRLELVTLLWALLLMPFQALVHLSSAALRGLKRVILGQLPDLLIIPGIFSILFLLFSFLFPQQLSSANAMALRAISTLIAFVVSFVLLIRKVPLIIRRAKPIYQSRTWFASALPLGLSSGLNMVKTRTTILIMGLFVSPGEIGTFQIAVSTAAIAALLLHATNSILAPQFASLNAQGEKKKLQRLVTISSRIIFGFNFGVTLIFVIFGKYLLSFVFGPELVDAYIPLLIILAGQSINSLVGSVAFLLNMTGYEKDVMKVIGMSTLANILITLIITPIWGIIGAAVSTTTSLIIAQFSMYWLVRSRLDINSSAFGKTR